MFWGLIVFPALDCYGVCRDERYLLDSIREATQDGTQGCMGGYMAGCMSEVVAPYVPWAILYASHAVDHQRLVFLARSIYWSIRRTTIPLVWTMTMIRFFFSKRKTIFNDVLRTGRGYCIFWPGCKMFNLDELAFDLRLHGASFEESSITPHVFRCE